MNPLLASEFLGKGFAPSATSSAAAEGSRVAVSPMFTSYSPFAVGSGASASASGNPGASVTSPVVIIGVALLVGVAAYVALRK